MKKRLIWIAIFLIVQVVVLFLVGFTPVSIEIKRVICVVFILIEAGLILHSDTTVKRKSPHKFLPDNVYVNEIIAELNLCNILNEDIVLEEYDILKSFDKKNRSDIAKAFIPNKYHAAKNEYESYVRFKEWNAIIYQIALWKIINNEQLYNKNRKAFAELVCKVYGYSFYNVLSISYLESIIEVSDNSIFAYQSFDFLQDFFYDYVKYCAFMKNNVTCDGFIIWAKVHIENNRVDERYIPVIIPALKSTHQCNETDTGFFPEIQESEVIEYIIGNLNPQQHFQEMKCGQ